MKPTVLAACGMLCFAAPCPVTVGADAAAMAPLSSGNTDLPSWDPLAVLPPPPKAGSARSEADRRIFRETRVLQGSARWEMARGDDALDGRQMLSHFACALDAELSPEQAPALLAFVQKATREATRGVGIVKDQYQRRRPFLVDEGATCLPKVGLASSFDYPSGHSAAGWSWALLLSQVAPARATPLLVRGRAIGESRVVCGVHNASSVEASRLVVSAAMSLVSASDGYRAELDAARQEFRRLAADPATRHPDPAACRAEARILEMPLPGLSDAGYPSASRVP
jgi:acid phosphatase (class A)